MSDRVSGQIVGKNILNPTTLKVGKGRCCMVSPTNDGAGVDIHDCASPSDVDASNHIAFCSAADFVSCILVDVPFYTGLTVVPTDGIAVCVSYV